MKSIMYHYVREYRSDLPYFRFLHIDNFRKQLDYFSNHHRIINHEEFLDCLRKKKCILDAVVLTFDDGLRDHYDYVLPELERRGLWGIFYVATGPLSNGKSLNVHLIHRLLGQYGGPALLEALRKIIEPKMLTYGHVEEFQKLTYPDQEDDVEAITLSKRILNYFIATEWQGPVIENILMEYPLSSTGDIYLTEEQISEIQKRGHIIGSHSVSHPVFSKLAVDLQRKEINDSFDFLDRILGRQKTRTFCYPYGGFHSFTLDTERLLTEAGCDFSFNVEYRDVDANDLTSRPQALPRYDCNLFPNGRAS